MKREINLLRMKSLKLFLCLLVFASMAAAQQKTIVPIATEHYLLGGVKDGKWLTAETVEPVLGKKTEMSVVGLKGATKNSVIMNNTGEEYGACPENKLIKIESKIKPDFVVGANASWNIVPRVPKLIAKTDKNYQKIAADFLRTKGIAKSKIVLNQVIEIDLEGDGSKEVIITGNFYKKGLMEDQTIGDYSFALLRKTVGGKAKNILIDGEFFTKRGAYDPPNERKILAVADLNGDGRMEIVLDTSYYEGSWKQVFEVSGTKLTKVLEASCLV